MNIFSKIIALILCSTSLISNQALHSQPEWRIHDKDSGWNCSELVNLYFHNSELQRQWASSVIARHNFTDDESILDFGSGDGKITAALSFHVPKGKVIGVDSSDEMISFASRIFHEKDYPNLDFIPIPIEEFEDCLQGETFDTISSFCTFHLLPDPLSTLQKLHSLLKDGGTLIATYPIGRNPAFFKAVMETLKRYELSLPYPTNEMVSMRNPENAAQILTDAGFKINELRVIESKNAFASKEKLADWFEGTLTANWNIPSDVRRDFFINLTDRYLELSPESVGPLGEAYFTLSRINCTASKSSSF
jgi:trans-aconitate 2-methyltransferase